jgi:ATP-dependent Clp protease ATP-binding subunit ClpX
MMGFVMVGAFESLWISKEQPATMPHIGFCADTPAPAENANIPAILTDEDFIAYGILPELVGRIAVKCATKPLSDEAYMDIIRGPHSRVAAIEQVLKQYGTEVADVISKEELRQMVATSKSNRTGVRWVSAQVENRLLEAIREHGLFPDRAA